MLSVTLLLVAQALDYIVLYHAKNVLITTGCGLESSSCTCFFHELTYLSTLYHSFYERSRCSDSAFAPRA